MNAIPGSSVQSVTASLGSTVLNNTTLGPFTISGSTSGGLWLLSIDLLFGVPGTAVSEEILLLDISSNILMHFHTNLGIAPMPPLQISRIWPFPGIRIGAVSSNQMQYTIQNPATTSGPGYSVNLVGYVV